MPDNREILGIGQTVVREIDHFGHDAEFIAYVSVAPQDGTEHVFITRGERHVAKPASARNVVYVRYRLPLGRIAEVAPGEVATVRVPEVVGFRSTGHFYVTKYSILGRDVFRLQWEDGIADAVENQLAVQDGAVFVPALREWISRTFEDIAAEAARPRRRRIAERFELADLPVVDRSQGDIWRADIRKFIVISGAPGTGKTTTAIKRIAHKTDATALVDGGEVTGIAVETSRTWLEGPKNWVLFTPSELLRGYLSEALGKEGLPATEERVPVWATTKVRIARDVMRLIGHERYFTLGKNLVQARNSKSLSNWARGFHRHVAQRIKDDLHRAMSEHSGILSDTIRQIGACRDELQSQSEPLRARLRALEAGIGEARNEQDRDVVRANINEVESRLTPLAHHLRILNAVLEIWADVGRVATLRENAPLGQVLSDLLAAREKVLVWQEQHNEERWPEAERPRLRTVVAAANDILSKFADESKDSMDAVFRKLPFLYQQYRLRASEGSGFYDAAAMSSINDKRLDPLELDCLIYVALQTLREAFVGRELVHRPGNSIT